MLKLGFACTQNDYYGAPPGLSTRVGSADTRSSTMQTAAGKRRRSALARKFACNKAHIFAEMCDRISSTAKFLFSTAASVSSSK